MRHEQFRKLRMVVERGNHRSFCDWRDDALFHRRGGGDTQRAAIEAGFAKELPGLYYPDHRFLSLLGLHGKLDPAFLKIKHRIRGIALQEDVLALAQAKVRLALAQLGEKGLRIKRVLGSIAHTNLVVR